ncbi:FAD-dependent oxidoreductase [Gryllotalpicola ginsengisoli]|uniref:FAD-dependent oxidoreductase n=1 Tax=Gryllotalpicola ginsengisoli TaxID=444608 RepID=UPI0003B608CF|nr:FAD-dependent oxidoreductase [Gryllotalpicola ginsengisoli]
MRQRAEVVVVGGGAMGSAAAWHLARAGREVLLLERFSPGHTAGSSHGPSRNFNVAYERQPYVALLVEALRLWRELEDEASVRLLDLVGMVTHGSSAYPELDATRAAGIPGEILPAAEAARRWPGMRFETDVLHQPEAGRLDADAAVAALQSAAVARGAVVRHDTPVLAIEPRGEGAAVVTEDVRFEASVVVVAAGAWTQKLLGGRLALPPLTVTQEQPAHFALRTPDPDAARTWPGFNHRPGPGDEWWPADIYGMYTPGFGVKAGWHGAGPVVDPDRRSFRPEAAQLRLLQRYVREWLPGADPARLEPISCMYTTTPDHDFVVDRTGPLVVAAGFSGHGFKFTPAIGRLLADLATGAAERGPAAFRLGR